MQANQQLNEFFGAAFQGSAFMFMIHKLGENNSISSVTTTDGTDADLNNPSTFPEGVPVDFDHDKVLKLQSIKLMRFKGGKELGLADLSLINLASLFAYCQSVGDLHSAVKQEIAHVRTACLERRMRVMLFLAASSGRIGGSVDQGLKLNACFLALGENKKDGQKERNILQNASKSLSKHWGNSIDKSVDEQYISNNTCLLEKALAFMDATGSLLALQQKEIRSSSSDASSTGREWTYTPLLRVWAVAAKWVVRARASVLAAAGLADTTNGSVHNGENPKASSAVGIKNQRMFDDVLHNIVSTDDLVDVVTYLHDTNRDSARRDTYIKDSHEEKGFGGAVEESGQVEVGALDELLAAAGQSMFTPYNNVITTGKGNRFVGPYVNDSELLISIFSTIGITFNIRD